MPGSNHARPADVIWLNTADLAARFRTDQGTIRYWRHTGFGPKGTPFGRRVLYRLTDVERWEAERAQQAQAAGRAS